MSNRIIKIKNGTQDNDNVKEVYRDISMLSKQWINRKNEVESKIDRLIDRNAVSNSLYNIFTWLKGERIINPEFGSDLRKLIYEGITTQTEERIVAEINHSVSKWEPRVTISKISNVSTVNDTEDNTIVLNIQYNIKGLDETYDSNFIFNKEDLNW